MAETKPPTTEEIVARETKIHELASKLHDAAFNDPELKKKPSWRESLEAAEKQIAADEKKSAAPATPKPAVPTTVQH